MARLLRKKTVDQKKKKKKAADSAAMQSGNGIAVKQTPLSPVSAGSVKKGPVLSQKKTIAKTHREPGKVKGYLNTSIQFLREVKIELKKVTWPTRKQTMGSTVVVIVLVMIISLFLGVIDVGLTKLISVVLH